MPLEDAEISLGKNSNWYCGYCKRKMTNESTFMRHHCPQKKKAQDFTSPTGQAAFGYYNTWMKLKKHSAQNGTTFQESKFFNSFMRFAEMVISANIAKPDKYIELMRASDIDPTLWCRASAYSVYLATIDKLTDPIEDVQDSLVYLMQLAEKEGIVDNDGNPDISKIVEHLGDQRMISLVRQKRISPWLIFNAKTFVSTINKLEPEQRKLLNTIVNADYLVEQFQKNLEVLKKIREIISDVGM